MSLRLSSRLKRIRTLALRVGVTLALVAASGVAVASTAQSATTNLGTLVFTPATGLATSPINIHTVSVGPNTGCPTDSASVRAVVNGPGKWVDIPLIGSDTSQISTTSEFDEPLGDTFAGIAQSNGLTITAGKYIVSLICQDSLGTETFGAFTSPLFFTSPTQFQANDPNQVAQSTTTKVTASPSSPAVAGTSVTFTAAVTPSAAAGTVQFKDGSTLLGTAQTVSGGHATLTTNSLSAASHSISAVFTPSTGAYSTSTASAITYVVNSATATNTTVTASPNSPQVAGTSVTFAATVTPSAATGTVQFKDGSAALGSAQTVSGGHATLTTSALSAASHSISAVFTPSTGTYSASTSPGITYVVSAPSAVSTSTVVTVNPASPVIAGTSVTFSAAVTPATPGTVQFQDASVNLGSVQTVSAGHATLTTSALTAGSHSITAVFEPTDTSAFTGSTSPALPFTVSPPTVQTTSVALAANPASPSPVSSPVIFTATVTPPSAVGSVQFKDGASNLGTSQPVSAATASLTTTALTSGSHQITAVFTPTDPVTYAASTSTASTYVISGGNLTATTSSLSANSASPIASGTPVTLTGSVTPVVAGTMQFQDGGSALGAPQTLVAGAATLSTSTLSVGSHTLTVVFTPADAGTYAASTSPSITMVVSAPTGSNLGTLTFNPTTGQDVSPLLISTHSTGATPGCPLPSTNVRAVINGPAGWVDIPAVGNDSSEVSNTVDFSVPIGDTFAGLSASNNVPLVAGKYDFTLYCQDDLGTQTFGTFTGSLFFTDSKHFQSTDPAGSTTSTTTSLVVGPDARQDLRKTVTLTASVTPANAVGQVQFKDTLTGLTTNLGSPTSLHDGDGQLVTTTLPFGLHTFTVVFTPTDAKKFTTSTSDSIVYVIALPVPPKLLSGAHIRGTTRVGGVLACDAKYNAGTSVGYSWFRNGQGIPGAGRSTYRLTSHDFLKTIACRATGKNLGGSTPSMSRTVVVGLQFRMIALPIIRGAHQVGANLVVTGGRWSPNPQAYNFIWMRDGKPISGATRLSHHVVKADMGHKLSVRVTVKAVFYNPGFATSRSI